MPARLTTEALREMQAAFGIPTKGTMSLRVEARFRAPDLLADLIAAREQIDELRRMHAQICAIATERALEIERLAALTPQAAP